MKSIFNFMLLFIACSSLYGQQQIFGTVINSETNSPVFSASIYFPQLEKGTLTDDSGSFIISNIPAGTYKMIVSSLGYTTYTAEVKLPASPLQIRLDPTAIEMEEVIISTPFHQLQSENVMKVERANVSELNRKGAITLSDGITQIAGVESLTTGVGIGKPVIRGLSSNRVLVYTQGIRLENQQYGDEHGLGINSKGIASVEVIKGPASLLYGSDAIGGVLYLNPENYASSNTTKAEVDADYYSNTLGYQGSLMAKSSAEKLKFLIRGSYASHSDYKTGENSRVANTRFNEKDLKTGIAYQNSKYKADLRYNFNQSNIGIPEGIGIQSKSKTPLLPFQEINNHIVSLNNKLFLTNSNIDLKIGYQFNNRKEFEEDDGDQEIDEISNKPALEMHLESLSYNLKYNLPKFGKFETIFGVQGMHQTNTNFGKELLIPNASTTDFGFFGTSHYHLESWDFQAGLRYDTRKIKSEEFGNMDSEEFIEALNRSFSSLNGAFGIKYQYRNKIIARLNLASGFRAPNLSELTSNGVHEGTNRYEIGNPNLNNEQNLQVDLALEWRGKHLEAFANAFHNSIDDYIFISPTGEQIEGNPVFLYTQDNAKLYGGEVGIHLHPHPLDWLHLESSFESITGKRNNRQFLPLIPANSLTNTFRIEFEEGSFLFDKYVFIRLKNTLNKTEVSAFESRTGGYSLLGAGLGGAIKAGKSKISIAISGNNLTNKTYISHLSRLKTDGISNIGRNISISTSWKF